MLEHRSLGNWSRFNETKELILEIKPWSPQERQGTQAGDAREGVSASVIGLGGAYAWKSIRPAEPEELQAVAIRLLLEKGWKQVT